MSLIGGDLRFVMWLIVPVSLWACAPVVSVPQEKPLSEAGQGLANVEIGDLAGVWEYQEGSVTYRLKLDRHGNGTYEWKRGRFQTTSLDNGTWKGTWHQQENDREGGFEIQLSQDRQTAAGLWWYTRIEEDQNPLNPGGSFKLRRLAISTTTDSTTKR